MTSKPLAALLSTGFVAGLTSVAAAQPEGDTGIASRYPGDVGIAADAEVLFVEDFEEGSIGAATARWEDVRNPALLSLATEVPAGSSGSASLLIHKEPGDGTSGGHLYRRLVPDGGTGYPEIYARMYVRIGAGSDVIHHFGTNLGGNNPPTAWPVVSAGNRPAGDSSFWTGIEPYGDAWQWDFYSYWMEMRSWENPDGTGSEFWGNAFLRGTAAESWAPVGPDVRRGEWTCIEMMLRVNDPATGRSGAQAFWIDGALVRRDGQIISYLDEGSPNGTWLRDKWSPEASGAPFEGFRWRSAPELLVNYVWLYVYTEQDSYDIPVWYDDVVVATSYIGPLAGSSPRPDGGVLDGGGLDGGVAPGTDASPSADGGSGADAGTDTTDGGCGCRVDGSRAPTSAPFVGIALALLLTRRRRGARNSLGQL